MESSEPSLERWANLATIIRDPLVSGMCGHIRRRSSDHETKLRVVVKATHMWAREMNGSDKCDLKKSQLYSFGKKKEWNLQLTTNTHIESQNDSHLHQLRLASTTRIEIHNDSHLRQRRTPFNIKSLSRPRTVCIASPWSVIIETSSILPVRASLAAYCSPNADRQPIP
jgi:hypothetical protein